MREVDWDHNDGWDRIEKAINSASKWALVMAVTAVLIRVAYQALTGH